MTEHPAGPRPGPLPGGLRLGESGRQLRPGGHWQQREQGKRRRIILKGELTSPINPKPGCRFAARCEYATARCQEPQELLELMPNHFVSCCRAKELNGL